MNKVYILLSSLLFQALSNDTEFLSFESLVSSAVRSSVDLLQSHVGGVITPSNTVTPLLLSAIHSTVVGQVSKSVLF